MANKQIVAYIAIAFYTFTSIYALNVPRDVLLLFDSSDEYRSNYFEIEKQFAIDIIEGIFNSDTRIGVYTFGRRAHVQFNLNLYNDIEQIRYAINHMWYSTGNGNLGDALDYTIDTAFTESSGDRECVPNVLFILTHKPVTDILQLKSIESKINQKIIRTFVLNMATNTSTEFISITGDSSRVMIVPELATLSKESSTVILKMDTDLPRSGCGQLTSWSVWSGCSSTCNFGQKFRTRECTKILDSDKDCDGYLTDGETCTERTCAVDGGWSFWGNWGGCSKSCENGIQNRFRTCTQPEPFGGGKPCDGQTTDTRRCNDWLCPDCSKTCPPGGHLSADCQLCQCASVTLFGRIMDDTNSTVEGANIYLNSRRNEPIAITDTLGKFQVDGVCIMNEDMLVQGKRHVDLTISPSEVNITHWTVDTIIEKKVAPVFNVQPENKIRMIGQSFTLCCSAVGHPSPITYKWYKNGVELKNQGTNGSLVFLSASKESAANYKCSTETEAGISQSTDAVVKVKDFSVDTCGPPTIKLKQLPAGCHVTGDSSKNESLDVGTCEQSACMLSSLEDNRTCSDWWFHHCCDVKDTEMVSITCEGFTYTTVRATSCECHTCVLKTTVSGRVTGKENGTNVPLQLGKIFVGNVDAGRTNMAGFFKFEVTKGQKRLVVTFHDDYFNKFLDVTKIIEVNEGMDNHVTIIAPIKPDPVPFNTQIGTEFQLGTGMEGEPPLGSIEIQEDSVVNLDGEPFRGTAKAVMHFVDPRDRDSLDTANGEFVSEVQDGSSVPLETFGLFNLGVYDDSGNELRINKNMRVSFDTSVLNITLDESGEPDIALWDYDINKGIWVENAKFVFEQNSAGRKLLSGSIHASMHPEAIKTIEIKKDVIVGEEKVQTGWTNMDKNVDARAPIFEYVPIKEKQVKQGVCYVSVSVYEDLSLKEPYPGSAVVTVYTRERDRSKYLGKSTTSTRDGRACIVTFCDKLVYLSVKDRQGVNLYPGKHHLPVVYSVQEADREITFTSVDLGLSYRCPDPSVDCKGPMYPYRDVSDCRSVNINHNSFQFKFAPFTRPPSISYAVGSKNIYDKLLSWYPVAPDTLTFRTCFMKVLIKIQDAYDIRLVAKSLLQTFVGDEFGTHDVGPISSPTSRNDNVRGACFEFRCPGYVRNGSHEYFNLSTAIEVHLPTHQQKRCSFRVLNNALAGFDPITDQWGDTGFRFTAAPGNNYGPLFGIFIFDKSPDDVEQICNSGTDSGIHLNGQMDPERNAAVEFDCIN